MGQHGNLRGNEPSLQVLPQNTTITAMRISAGGNLLLKSLSEILYHEDSTDTSHAYKLKDCKNIVREGKICKNAPFATYLHVTKLKTKQRPHSEGPHREKDEKHGPTVPATSNEKPQGAPNITSKEATTFQKEMQKMEEEKPLDVKSAGLKRLQFSATCSSLGSSLNRQRQEVAMAALLKSQENKNVKQAWKSQLPGDLATLPAHTLLVKWKLSFNFPNYLPETVYIILSRYGKVKEMASLGHQSALVVFDKMNVAARVLSCQTVGFSNNPLICSWLYPEMNKCEHRHKINVQKVFTPHVESYLTRFKEIQGEVEKFIGRKVHLMSYDMKTYRP